jgi:hypothetical protein
MTPRKLRYLRINDRLPPPYGDETLKLPVVTIELTRWYDFCRDISRGKTWSCELMTIDFNFKDDPSGPPCPPPDARDTPADGRIFPTRPFLAGLRWANTLVDPYIGPNSGLSIGLHLIRMGENRDLPCGVGFHTLHPTMIVKDMTSAMMATQILVESGVPLPMTHVEETLEQVVEIIEEGSKHRLIFQLLAAVRRFRDEFLRRAGVRPDVADAPVRLWMESASLRELLAAFVAATDDDDLDKRLARVGVEFTDRRGVTECLDVRSLFLDLLYRPNQHGVHCPHPRLRLEDVKPGTGDTSPGPVWRFIEQLWERTPSNVEPVLRFFRTLRDEGAPPSSINKAVKRVHRPIAMIYAWLYEYGERWINSSRVSWDPVEDTFDGDFPPMTTQIRELIRIVDQLERTEEDREHSENASGPPLVTLAAIMDAIREQGRNGLLSGPLRLGGPDSRELRERRERAVRLVLGIAARWGCIDIERDASGTPTDRYRVKTRTLPAMRPFAIGQKDVARHLGFRDVQGGDPSTELKRILKASFVFEDLSVEEFLRILEEEPLPEYLKQLAWEFTDEFWAAGTGTHVPEEAWPLCLGVHGPRNATLAYHDWKHRMHQSLMTAVRVQAAIAPPEFEERRNDIEIWCRRQSIEEIGGDYYHIPRATDGVHRLCLADIRGHGLAAALVMHEMHGRLTALASSEPEDPAAACTRLNSQLPNIEYTNGNAHDDNDRWASFVCVDVDPRAGTLAYANAGHPSPLVVRSDGTHECLHSQAPPVGLVSGSSYRCDSVAIRKGDRLVFYTDGLIEGGQLSETDLLQLVIEHRAESAAEIGQCVLEAAKGDKPPNDDVTLIVVALT